MRETLLGKALKDLLEFEEPDFEVDPALDYVEEEIKAAQRKFHLSSVRARKERVLIAAEIASLAMEECLFEIAFKAASLAVMDEWDPIKNADLVIAQSQAHFILAGCYVENLLEDDIEIGFKDLITVEEDQDDREFTNEERSKFHEWKTKFPYHIIQGVRQGQMTQQTWLIFNGAIDFWNNYLPVFRKSNYYELLMPEGVPALVECFEGMNNCFINAAFNSESIDYELEKKMQVFTNLSVMLARLYEFNVKNDDAVRVCDILLQKQLPSHLRKTFDSIKARVTKQVSNLATLGQAKGGAAPAKGKDPQPAATNTYQPSKTDILTSEILSYLELIQNGNKELITKAYETLNTWAPNQLEEIELELNAELWCRLGRLAINVNTNAQIKVGLFCAEQCFNNACQQYKKKNFNAIPVTRLRWYSVGESLYGEALYKLLDSQKQEKEAQDQLLHKAVSRFVEACSLGARANISFLVLEAGKLMWNALIPLLESPHNRKLLIKPMSMVHDFLKQVHESSDPDFLVLFYSALFECIREQRDWKLGEQIVEEAFLFVPQTHQKVLWEAKMLFLSKLGKNVLNAISNMKESNASLMAKVWVKLARSSANQLEQHSAYNKAIEILRKEESVEVVEVLIEYAEWLQRNKYSTQDIEDQLLLGVDILMDFEPGWGDDEDEEELQEGEQEEAKTRKTGKSKSSKISKGSKAQTKKSNLKSKAGGKSMKSKVSKRSASMRSKTGSRVSKKTTTALSKRQEEESQPMFLNCSHFEKLVRIHSMMAMVAADSHKQREYALDAHYFIMKLWEQTFQTLNAHIFFEEHKAECEELGFRFDQQESRRQFFFEALTNNELGVPTKFALPEKPEDWINFSIPEQLLNKSNGHEDKLMVSKWTFVKPELTFFHLENVANILEDHYFSIQLLPVLEVLSFFGRVVLEDRKIEDISILRKARLMMNLGLKQEGEGLKNLWEQSSYKLTDDEKKIQLEKIKGLKDPNDNLKDKAVDFPLEEAAEPLVLEQIKIHEVWLKYGQELLKWGEFIKAKEFILEVNIHSRILKDQEIYSHSLMLLSTIAFLEGESASAMKCDMLCHQYAKSMSTVEKAIEHTFDLLLHFGKLDDCRTLIDPSIKMFGSLYDQWIAQGQTHGGNTKGNDPTQNNLPLEYAIGTVNILKAILSLKEAQQLQTIEEQQRKINDSFSYIEKFETQQTRIGFKHSQLLRLLQLSSILSEDVGKSAVQADIRHVDLVKSKLERNASILLKVQELVTNQVYFIGVHQDSYQTRLSLPLVRLLGIVKLRIAQVNTSIGIMKNSLKLSSDNLIDPTKKIDKIVSTFLDAVTKQIDAQTNTYKQKMNRYEKSISILYSALNMIHSSCPEYAEAMVEIAKNRRLLAVNKKHLRGQWRQDAIDVDKVNLRQIQLDEQKDRKDQLEEKGLNGEVADMFVDYKEEALKTFVDLLESKTEVKLVERLSGQTLDTALQTFALEYAECRGNLNKEQSFFYLALYQYAVSRQFLFDIYLKSASEKHPDILRLRQLEYIRSNFQNYTSPVLPKHYAKTEEDIKESSKPLKLLTSFSTIEELKDGLPSQTAFLILQLSEDKQHLYYGLMYVTKERKFNYYVSKISFSDFMREKLGHMVEKLAQIKVTMQKTPITIEEDLIKLEVESERDVTQLINELESYFEPMSANLDQIINPPPKVVEEEDPAQQQQNLAGKGGAPPKKDDKKAPPAKAPAGKPAAGGKGGPGELAAYESNLPLPTSGIESLILLVDHRIESLPFETLKVFSKIPVLSRDFNLHLHMQRLKTIGHQALIHNNTGIQKENLRYIFDAPQPIEDKCNSFMVNDLPKLMPTAKWDGLLTKQHHVPSQGEWQRLISQSSLFMYYSMTSLVHKFPPSFVSDLSIFSKCRAMIIMDRMNTFKTMIDRNILTSKFYVPNEQPTHQAALFSLCGVSSIVTSLWAIKPEASIEAFQTLLRGTLAEGSYLGAALRKFRANAHSGEEGDAPTGYNPDKKLIYRANMVTYGVPIIRVV